MIDLRSDTVTKPSDAMRAAMAKAPVGDMQYGDDPTLNALEARVAQLLGKEASMWLPSGTMANQVGLRVLTRPGDDVLVASDSQSVWHEAVGSAANSGVQFTDIGSGGTFSAGDVRRHAKPLNSPLLPLPGTTLVQIENMKILRIGSSIHIQGLLELVQPRVDIPVSAIDLLMRYVLRKAT